MKLTCPSGQSVNIFNSSTSPGGLFPGGFAGSNTFLGGAFDNNTGNVGVCEQYCFSNLNGAMPAFVNGYNTIAASGQSPGVMVVPGLYEPEESYLPSLVGCPVNGIWTLTVRDNFIFDDGFICEWGIYFNSILSPNQVTYSPAIVSANWVEVNSTVTTIISYLDTNIVVNPPSIGTYNYKFEVDDEFGCKYDTMIEIVVELGGSIIGDTTTCGDVFDYNNNYLTNSGGQWSYTGSNGNISFEPNNTVANPMITASEPGTYVMNLFDLFCNDTLTNIITLIAEPIAKQFSLDTICLDQEVLTILDSSNSNFIYRWFDNSSDTLSLGDTLRITGSYYSDAGISTIKLSVSNQCGEEISENDLIIEDCVIPNVITPNGDGLNDFFITKYAEIYNDVNISILNRWGKLVYEASNYQNQWNGLNSNGSKLNGGTYYYFITYNQGIGKTKGTVQIISK
jgi:gliding motility-associated-like protein